MTIAKQNSGDLKTRVNSCLTKLSDRDTLTMASKELEAIARELQDDAFAPFLNCLSATDSSEKSPVRRQCVRLLSVLSAAHGDALSPHLSRMISTVLRRLRDPDSSVRAACVDAVSSITTHVNSPPFAVILKPLVDALFHEQDANAQIGASLCLSAAVEAAPEPDAAELRRLLPRVLKLVKSDCPKAKPALLSFIGSVVGAGALKSKSLLSSVVSTTVEFLSSEDWAARKAAAEILEKVASAERNLAPEFKDSCVSALESKRFDKVKLVRERMNRALEMWKDLPHLSGDVPSPTDNSSRGPSPIRVSKINVNTTLETPQPRTMVPKSSPPANFLSMTNNRKGIIGNEDVKPCVSTSTKLNLKRNSRSRVVPFNCNDHSSLDDGCDAINENEKEFEDLSLIRKQLVQIEKQQSNLLDLLQRFMGSSQKGMSSLEKRVDGLEKVLDVMSQDLGISSRRFSSTDSGGNACCMIPGAEFLSPKFWRKNEAVSSKLSSPFRNHQYTSADIQKLGSPRS